MWKKIFLFASISLAVAIFVIFFAWRLKFIELPARLALEKITGLPVSFSKIEYRPFTRVTINDFTAGSTFRCKSITVYFNPVKLLSSLQNPQGALTSLHIDSPVISTSFNTKLLSAHGASPKKPSNFSISWEDGKIIGLPFALSSVNGILNLDSKSEITAKITAISGTNKLSTSLSYETPRISISASLSGDDKDAELILDGTYDTQNGFKADARFPKLKYDEFSLTDSSGTVEYNRDGFTANLKSTAGDIAAYGVSTESFTITSSLDISKIFPHASGIVELSAQENQKLLNGSARISGLTIAQRQIGNADLTFLHTSNEWSAKGNIESAKCSFELLIKDGFLTTALSGDNKSSGKISGQLSPVNLAVNIDRWPVIDIPGIFSGDYGDAQGNLSLSGNIAPGACDFKIAARQWQIENTPPINWNANIAKKDNNWFLKSSSEDKQWQIDMSSENNEWGVKGKLQKLQIENILPWVNRNIKLTGIINGDFSYSSQKKGDARFSVINTAYNGIFFNEGKFALTITPEMLEVKNFSFYSGRGAIAGQASLGIKGDKGNCKINTIFSHFPIKESTLDGPVAVSGSVEYGRDWKFDGNIKSAGFKFNALPSKKVSADLKITPDEVRIEDLSWETFAKGNIFLKTDTRQLGGELKVNALPVNTFIPELKGTIKGLITLGGTLEKPFAAVSYSCNDMSYGGINFTNTGKILYQNSFVFIDNAKGSSGNAAVEIHGKVYPVLELDGTLKTLSAPRIMELFKISTPIKGNFSGSFKVHGKNNAPVIDIETSAQDVEICKIPFSELGGKFKIENENIIISSFSARSGDSELRLLSDSIIELQKKQFNLVSEWRNMHLGPADLFGKLILRGSWNPDLNLRLTADDFWINQHNTGSISVGVKYQNNTVSFLPVSGQPLQISGHVGILNPDKFDGLKFERLLFNWNDEKSFSIDGQLRNDVWDFIVQGKAISSESLAELINSPITVDGNLDCTIIGKGNADDPQIEASVNLSDGNIRDIPYDNINAQLSVKNHELNILRARLIKQNEYTLSADGYLPFYLTRKTTPENIKSRPIGLNITMEKGALSILSSISSDIRSASGDMLAQVNLTGTYGKPEVNGYLKVTGAQISAKRYFNKISDLNVYCVWKDDLLTFKEFSGKIGEGNLKIDGSVEFDGLTPLGCNVNIHTVGAKGISIFITELPIPSPLIKPDKLGFLSNYSRGEPKLALNLKGDGKGVLLSGWVELENTHFTYPPRRVERGEKDDPMAVIWPYVFWDLELRSGKNTWYDSELVSINTQGGVKLSGKGAFPAVSGRVESVRGTISYLGTEFRLKRTVLEIIKGDILLDAEAEAETYSSGPEGTDIINMYIDRSKIGLIKPRFVSKANPGFSSEKALSRATGIDPEIYATSDSEYMLRQQLIRFFDSTLTTPLAKTLLRNSGLVDTFRVQHLPQEPLKPLKAGNPTVTELLYGTKYSLEKYLGARFLLGYSVTFDQIQNKLDLRHEIELSYRLQHNIFFRGTYEIETTNPFRQYDRRIIVEQQWRFGWPKKSSK